MARHGYQTSVQPLSDEYDFIIDLALAYGVLPQQCPSAVTPGEQIITVLFDCFFEKQNFVACVSQYRARTHKED